MIIVGATLENFIYNNSNGTYLSAGRFVPKGKFGMIELSDAKFYSNLDVMKIHLRPIAYYSNWVGAMADNIYSALSIEQGLISKSNANCVIHNCSQVNFSPSELSDSCVKQGMNTYYTNNRAAGFDLHFSAVDLNQSKLADILDNNLKEFHSLEEDNWRKDKFGQLGRNMFRRQYMYYQRELIGIEYKTFSAGIIKDHLFDFLHAVKASIDEYNRS